MSDRPAFHLKDLLIAAGVPVRAVCYSDRQFTVTYEPHVTKDDVAKAEPIIAAAAEQQHRNRT